MRSLLLPLAAALLLTACRSTPSITELRRFEFTHPAMGTLFSISLYATNLPAAESAAQDAFRRIDQLEDRMSDYQADSELLVLCDKPFGKPVPVSADLFEVLSRAQKVSAASGGAFDVTVGPYVRLWRFARKRKVLPTPAELAAARPAVGYQKLKLEARARTVTLLVPNMRLDLGGIAKGYAADAALSVLKGRGINSALVAASGDLAVGDSPPGQVGWKVGISVIDAHDNQLSRTLILHNAGVSTSGDTEQFIEIGGVRYSHILDPATGLGLTNRIQASIVAPDATATDVLATTVCVLGPLRGMALVESLPHTAALILLKLGGENRTLVSGRFSRIPQAN